MNPTLQRLAIETLESSILILSEALESAKTERETPLAIAHSMRLAINLLQAAEEIVDGSYNTIIGAINKADKNDT